MLKSMLDVDVTVASLLLPPLYLRTPLTPVVAVTSLFTGLLLRLNDIIELLSLQLILPASSISLSSG